MHKKFSSVGNILDPTKLYKTNRKINEIIVHCSYSPQFRGDTAFDIDMWHKQRWGSKSGIGYHYVILESGELMKGRWVDFPGAHAKGHNRNSIGICYIGGMKFDDITEQQKATLKETLDTLKSMYKCPIIGHNEVSSKDCPNIDLEPFK